MTIEPGAVVSAVKTGCYHKRAVRLMLMQRDLAQGNFYTVEALADRYSISESTVYRDLAELQAEPLREPIVNLTVWGRMIADSICE